MSAFKHYPLRQASRHNLVIQSFAGVDYSTQKFLVANNRAIDLLNYVYKNGIVQKRNGVEEVYEVKPYNYLVKDFNDNDNNVVKANSTNFNGMWKFIAEDNKEHVIAHIGKLLYEVTNLGTQQVEISAITIGQSVLVGGLPYFRCYEFEDYKSSAFVGGNKLWFLGGNKYMCLRYTSQGITFAPVENHRDFTPIPTTSISRTYKNSIASGGASLDKVNLLTMWRKNKLLSGTTKKEDERTKTPYYEYTLDAPLICKNTIRDMANFSMIIEERGVIDNG